MPKSPAREPLLLWFVSNLHSMPSAEPLARCGKRHRRFREACTVRWAQCEAEAFWRTSIPFTLLEHHASVCSFAVPPVHANCGGDFHFSHFPHPPGF